MKPELLSPVDLLAQLLTTDYGGVENKCAYLICLLRDPELTRKAMEILERPR